MTKQELLEELNKLPTKSCDDCGDCEINHQRADFLLLEYIDDKEIIKLFKNIPKWYA